MKRIRILKLLTVVLVMLLIVGIAKSSFAAPTISPIDNSTGNGTNNTINGISSNELENNTLNNVIENNTPVNNTTLPDTGAKSSTGLIVLIVLTSVSAVYTYIKVKEYNI